MQAQESLRFHAEHDSLTGVLNRRAIRDVLRKELARCRRENQTLGVIVADVDHFKTINDHYGHGAGDAALVAVVHRISATLRPYDVIGRYGGEEFLIIAAPKAILSSWWLLPMQPCMRRNGTGEIAWKPIVQFGNRNSKPSLPAADTPCLYP
jgi:GGDEF domain-containing protein